MKEFLPPYREPSHWVENRQGLKLAVWIDDVPGSRGVFYGQHGMYEGALAFHNQAAANVLKEFGYTTVFFDAAHSGNFSGGNTKELTWDSHFGDLESIIEWGQQQQWSHSTYSLYGRSLGGTSSLWHAAQFPQNVERVIALSPPISGVALSDAFDKASCGIWKRSGDIATINTVKGEFIRAYFDSEGRSFKYDILDRIQDLTMPVLLMVGSDDIIALPSNVEKLYEVLPGPKTIKIFPGKGHKMFTSERKIIGSPDEDSLKMLKGTIEQWLKEGGLQPTIENSEPRLYL